ncbi:hypothetical protein NC651_013180 [Populus alba x Populus x berolinensis]|nr:hypothetical protein NC651_013180 [Populus alba x Populus x berolinensis]
MLLSSLIRPLSIQKQPTVLEETSTIKRRLSPHQGQQSNGLLSKPVDLLLFLVLPGRQQLKLVHLLLP